MKDIKMYKKALLMTLSIFMLFTFSKAQAADPIYTSTFSSVAVQGYDTVAYFTKGRPVKGSKNFSTEWNGAEWRFTSQEHLNLFEANPTKYAPQYGGYCAFATAHGSLAPGKAEQWHIENGKLYLNLNADIQRQWLSNISTFIPQSDVNYPNLIK
jgi:YHS domain-containing protein